VTVTINTTVTTLGKVSVLTQGARGLDFANAGLGPCTLGTTSASCSVNVTFTPKFAGTRYGAVVIQDASGYVVGTTYLQSTGTGPQVTFLPGAESTLPSSTLAYPFGVAVDGSGNVYIADAGNNRVLKETLSAGVYTESTVPTSIMVLQFRATMYHSVTIGVQTIGRFANP
jgi:hypothetical protein